MSSIFRLLALGMFGVVGVAIAIFLATSLPALDPSEAPQESNDASAPQLPVATIASPSSESVPSVAPAGPAPDENTLRYVATNEIAAAAPVAAPTPVPVHKEYAQQLPMDLSQLGGGTGANDAAAGQPSLNQLGELGKALLEQLNTQQGNNNAAAPKPPAPRGRAAAPQPADMAEGEEDEEGEGDGEDSMPTPPAPGRRGGSGAPSSFKITKLPGEGDDHLSVHIQNKDLRDVLDFLGEQGGISILASNNVNGVVSVSLNDVSIDTALSAILKSTGFVARREGKFIYVGTPKDILQMAQAVDRVATRVYRPNYVKASELQQLILPLLTPAGSVTGGGTTGNSAVAVSPPSQVGIAADNNMTGGDSFAEGEVIVVRDYEAVLTEIDQLIAEVDKRPMQVAIEAMLLSVEIKDTNSFGVDFQFLRDKQHIVLATGSPLADLGQVSFSDGGLKLGFLDSSFGAFLAALQTIGDTNVIATPRLMCLNKHRAEILIGAQLGYVTKTLTQTTTAQSVEFLEVGTQLRLRPFISNDGLIRMEVHPEISTGSVDVQEGFTLPNKQTTQVTTNIMVRDGCTVVIGGLMQEALTNSGSQVPFFGSAPGIGFLFRSRKGTQTRNEIIVLITPHIVYEPESAIEGEKAACDFHRQHAVYKDNLNPLNSRYVGRKFFRLAQNAWAANDRKAAMRFINMAIHFDPQNRASVDLRSDIMAGNHFGPNTGTVPMMIDGPTEAVDGEQIAPWVLDELENGEVIEAALPHPRDPGAPGRVIHIERGAEFR